MDFNNFLHIYTVTVRRN